MEVVNRTGFEQAIAEGGVVLVDFFADWCGPCKMLAPELEKLALEFGEKIRIIKVNVDDEMDLARQFNVVSIPNLVLFKDGEVYNAAMGYMPVDRLRQFVETAF